MESQRSRLSSERHSGMSDFVLDAKLRVLKESRRLPAFSVISGVSIPIGGKYFSSGGHDPFFKLCWSKELPKGFDAAGNFNYQWDRGSPETMVEQGYSISIGHALAGGFKGFWEVYRISPITDDERAHYIPDTGVSRSIGANAQLDFSVGHTMMARTHSWLIAAGVSVRGPVGAWFRRRFRG